MGTDLVGGIALAGMDSAGDLIADLPEQCSMFTASDGFRVRYGFLEEVEGGLAIKHVHNDRHVPWGCLERLVGAYQFRPEHSVQLLVMSHWGNPQRFTVVGEISSRSQAATLLLAAIGIDDAHGLWCSGSEP
jgi:hypothetical protein